MNGFTTKSYLPQILDCFSNGLSLRHLDQFAIENFPITSHKLKCCV